MKASRIVFSESREIEVQSSRLKSSKKGGGRLH
jgi:hypothetical protein